MTNGDPPPHDWTKIILSVIVWVLIAVVVGTYVGVVVWAGEQSLKSPSEPSIPLALTGATTAVASALATNLGAFLGVSIGTRSIPDSFKAPTVQALFGLFYVLVLIVAFSYWGRDHFSSQTAELIRTQVATLLGVGVGVLAVKLNTKP